MQGVGRKKMWVEKLVTKHWIDLLSGRAEIAAGCPESPKACWQSCGWAFASFLGRTSRQHELYMCTQLPWSILHVCVSAWQAKAQGCENNSFSCGKEMIRLPSGWQRSLCQCTSWPIQDLWFTHSRMKIHLMGIHPVSVWLCWLMGIRDYGMSVPGKKAPVSNQVDRVCSYLRAVQEKEAQTRTQE